MKRRKNGGRFPQKTSNRRNPDTGKREKQLSAHIFLKDRWVLTTPDKAGTLPQIFLSEEKAMSVANGIARNQQTNVEVTHEHKNEEGNWVEVSE